MAAVAVVAAGAVVVVAAVDMVVAVEVGISLLSRPSDFLQLDHQPRQLWTSD